MTGVVKIKAGRATPKMWLMQMLAGAITGGILLVTGSNICTWVSGREAVR